MSGTVERSVWFAVRLAGWAAGRLLWLFLMLLGVMGIGSVMENPERGGVLLLLALALCCAVAGRLLLTWPPGCEDCPRALHEWVSRALDWLEVGPDEAKKRAEFRKRYLTDQPRECERGEW